MPFSDLEAAKQGEKVNVTIQLDHGVNERILAEVARARLAELKRKM